MLQNESLWINKNLQLLGINDETNILNFGSQSRDKLIYQPFLQKNILQYITECKSIIKNLDIIDGEGVDIWGDIFDNIIFNKLTKMEFDLVLLNNVLEHVEDIQGICNRIEAILPSGSYIIFSGPYKYFKHLDPIDNMFRPSIADIAELFPGCTIIDAAQIKDITYWDYLRISPRIFISEISRVMTPFYKFKKWKNIILPKLKWLDKNFEVTCVLMQKKELNE